MDCGNHIFTTAALHGGGRCKPCSYIERNKDGRLSGKNSKTYGRKASSKQILQMSESAKKAWKQGKHKNSLKTTFKKGQTPWNKDLSVRLGIKGEFKKGHKFSPEIEQLRIQNLLLVKQKKNKPEKRLENILIKLKMDFKYVGDGKLMVEKFNPDFVNVKQKKIIEVFGDYWHNRPIQKKKDWFRFKIFKRNGYKTLVVWEYELKKLTKTPEKLKLLISKLVRFNDK
jgi:G:T-mismatch repair DNA endonuclease (very short patch repair protein)